MAGGGTELFSGAVFNCSTLDGKPATLGLFFDTSNFGWLQRGPVSEFLMFASRECVARTAGNQRQSVSYNDHVCHVARLDSGLAVAVITTETYHQRVAHYLVEEIVRRFLSLADAPKILVEQKTDAQLPVINNICTELVKKFQVPHEADKILKIQKDLDDTKIILVQSMDKLLDRGEALDSLANKSGDLSLQSKIFLDQASGLNSCCSIL